MIGRVLDRVRGRYALKVAIAIAVVVAVVAGVGAVAVAAIDAELGATVESTMVSQARAEATGVDDWLDSHREFTRLVSTADHVAADDPDEVRSGLRETLERTRNGDVVGVYVIDRRAKRVVTAVGSARPERDDPYWGRLFFQDFGDVITTDPYGANDGRAVAFASPVEGNTSRVVVVAVRADGVSERFETPYGAGFTAVVDSSGTVVFGTDTASVGEPYATGNETPTPVRRGLRGQSGFQDAFPADRGLDADHVRSYAPVAATDWVVVKHAPSDAAYAVSRAVRRTVLALVAIVLVGAVGAYGLVGWRTTRTLESLSRRARAVAAGERDTDLGVDRDDEFGDLGDAIANMRDDLVARIATVERQERHLATLVENLPATLVAFDADGVITAVAGRHVDALAPADAVGADAATVLADGALGEACFEALAGDPVSTTLTVPAGTFDVQFSPTDDGGTVVVAHDVTDRITRQQRIDVLNRVLRHDVRNRLNVVLGQASTLRDHVADDAGVRALDDLVAETERVVELSEDARAAQAVIDADTTPVDLSAAVRDAVAFAENRHDDLSVTRSVTEDCWGDATVHVGRAVEELLSLAVERVSHDEPVSATVELRHDGDMVVLAVADDGRPVPETERRCVERGAESKLEHVSGVGLWLVYWTVTLGGGDMTIADAPAGGALVTCRFRACDPERVDADEPDGDGFGLEDGHDTSDRGDAGPDTETDDW
ncbi:HAMP domain-containing protein [Halorubellus sp. PRR65]|uniref:HAMP domain-containing protein n=1 Tax=Halorubellus sp. PRR65 TaxID=3098148 RepID=UPI002B25A5E3|nr:HAMP domain-containing protein [Halorubellus sp. PRR65]